MSDTDAHSGDGESPLCLDFANQFRARSGDDSDDPVAGYQNLVSWAEQSQVLAGDDVARLGQAAARRPGEAGAVWRRAADLGESIHQIFTAVTDEYPPETADLEILNALLIQAQSKRQLVYAPQGFLWEWVVEGDALEWILWRVALSAADLLTSDRLDRVKRCADDDCGWLFLDTSRNRSRRWCDMSDCGNRAKARRYYKRSRDA